MQNQINSIDKTGRENTFVQKRRIPHKSHRFLTFKHFSAVVKVEIKGPNSIFTIVVIGIERPSVGTFID